MPRDLKHCVAVRYVLRPTRFRVDRFGDHKRLLRTRAGHGFRTHNPPEDANAHSGLLPHLTDRCILH